MIWGIGGAVGVISGGWIGQQLHNRCQTAMPAFVGLTVAAAALPTWWLINAPLPHGTFAFLFFITFVAGIFASTPGPNAR
jgi:hypothetical protein